MALTRNDAWDHLSGATVPLNPTLKRVCRFPSELYMCVCDLSSTRIADRLIILLNCIVAMFSIIWIRSEIGTYEKDSLRSKWSYQSSVSQSTPIKDG